MYHNQAKQKQAGFTIIELTLAMAFLAFVMVFSATLVIQLSNTYFKGLTIKQINQAGRTVTDDLSRSLRGSAEGINLTRVQDGLLCVGESAYIWNPVYKGATYNSSNINRYKFSPSGETISLARVAASSVGNCNSGILPTNIAASVDNVALLGDRSRVVSATATRSLADPKLVQVKLLIGSFDQSESNDIRWGNLDQVTNSVYYDGSKFTCRPDRLGNFCAFAEFQTTVYVTR